MHFSRTQLALVLAGVTLAFGAQADTNSHEITDQLIADWQYGTPLNVYAELVDSDVTYSGTGIENITMTQIVGNNEGAIHNEGAIIHGSGHILTIDKINNLTIKGLGETTEDTAPGTLPSILILRQPPASRSTPTVP